MRIIMHRPTRLTLLTLTGLLLALPVWAQGLGAGGVSGGIPAGKAGGTIKEEVRTPEPAALPGARTSPGPAPLSKPPSEMGPTEALFDAVNRGDRAAAQEAVTRGGDLNARNVLGLTALELAIDLSNNDIAFLLLSLRDADSGPARGKGSKAASAPARPAAAGTAATRPARPAAPTRTAAAAPVSTQRQAPSDGGVPAPNAGFLGFGGGR